MKIQRYFKYALLLWLPLFLAGCQPYIKESSYSCLNPGSAGECEEEDEIIAQVEGNSIYVAHLNASYNCCPDDIKVILSFEENNLKLSEEEINPVCDCICCYNIETEIKVFIPGEYIIEVCWDDWETQEELCDIVEVVIPN